MLHSNRLCIMASKATQASKSQGEFLFFYVLILKCYFFNFISKNIKIMFKFFQKSLLGVYPSTSFLYNYILYNGIIPYILFISLFFSHNIMP